MTAAMSIQSTDGDTICALSTAPGVSGIAVIRVSGPNAAALGQKICPFLPPAPQSHHVYYGIAKTQTGDPIDEVLVTYFAEKRSFSGESTVEISCHGGQILTGMILNELVQLGSRIARRGEFSYRAFMNGRIDLVQAESVHTLIQSQTKQSARLALRQLQGRLSDDLKRVEDDLLWILSQLEASIDFSSEGIEVKASTDLLPRTSSLTAFIQQLMRSYEKGRTFQNGFVVAIIGAPNVGKSSLLNAILKEERAIVTAHAGTTRDLVEGRLTYEGIPVTFVDTAGIRVSDDEVESKGIARSRSMAAKSDFVFHVFDLGSVDCESELQNLLLNPFSTDSALNSEFGPFSNSYFLFNKSDLDREKRRLSRCIEVLDLAGLRGKAIVTSAVDRSGIEKIDALFIEKGREFDSDSSDAILQTRHFEILQKIRGCLVSASELMRADSSPEFIAFELQEAVHGIHELLGKDFDEQVIDRIFKEFCLGK